MSEDFSRETGDYGASAISMDECLLARAAVYR